REQAGTPGATRGRHRVLQLCGERAEVRALCPPSPGGSSVPARTGAEADDVERLVRVAAQGVAAGDEGQRGGQALDELAPLGSDGRAPLEGATAREVELFERAGDVDVTLLLRKLTLDQHEIGLAVAGVGAGNGGFTALVVDSADVVDGHGHRRTRGRLGHRN